MPLFLAQSLASVYAPLRASQLFLAMRLGANRFISSAYLILIMPSYFLRSQNSRVINRINKIGDRGDPYRTPAGIQSLLVSLLSKVRVVDQLVRQFLVYLYSYIGRLNIQKVQISQSQLIVLKAPYRSNQSKEAIPLFAYALRTASTTSLAASSVDLALQFPI